MRCIFCKQEAANCISVEHIIPETLGNVEHILPRGWVCDLCNNYFSREIEKPFLDSPWSRSMRFRARIPNKKGMIRSDRGFHLQSRTKVEMFVHHKYGLSIAPTSGEDESKWVASFQKQETGTLLFLEPDIPEPSQITSRFIGKVALEALAAKCLRIPGSNDEIVEKAELDELRLFVRRGHPQSVWPIVIRRIYPPDSLFRDDSNGTYYEISNEWMILRTRRNEFYGIVAIFGVEFAINLAGPELDGFQEWLAENHNRSPLSFASSC